MNSQPCSFCSFDIPEDWTHCPHCARPQLFPNVVRADRNEECDALDQRYTAAINSAKTRNCESQVRQFEREIGNSRAVMSCSFNKLLPIASGHVDLYATYHQLASLRFLREPASGQPDWAVMRPNSEIALLGSDKHIRELHYAALTLTGRGVPNYGECEILLREEMTAHRTSVFEENSVLFMIRHTFKPPFGFRCNWAQRQKLCVAKLASQVSEHSTSTDFPQLLLKPNSDPLKDEFVEAHVFGPMTFRTFEKVTLSNTKAKAKGTAKRPRPLRGNTYVKALRDMLKQANAEFEISP